VIRGTNWIGGTVFGTVPRAGN